MNCIVTAGPTFEPLDEVRRLTNFSTGRLGTELANFLAAHGHQVTLLIGESATYPGTRQATNVTMFSTTEDLSAKLKSFSGKKVDAIFHAAAVSDFAFGNMFALAADGNPAGKLRPVKPSKKISTRRGKLLVELVPTLKIIAGLRDWFPRTKIFGWKYEAVGGRQSAIRAARRQLSLCATDYCVANGPAYGAGFCLVGPAIEKHYTRVEKLFAALEESVH
jgi:phosphopantothenoylcysteine synthetase/decarboxylase